MSLVGAWPAVTTEHSRQQQYGRLICMCAGAGPARDDRSPALTACEDSVFRAELENGRIAHQQRHLLSHHLAQPLEKARDQPDNYSYAPASSSHVLPRGQWFLSCCADTMHRRGTAVTCVVSHCFLASAFARTRICSLGAHGLSRCPIVTDCACGGRTFRTFCIRVPQPFGQRVIRSA